MGYDLFKNQISGELLALAIDECSLSEAIISRLSNKSQMKKGYQARLNRAVTEIMISIISLMRGVVLVMDYQICTRCVMDTTDPDIIFDSKGICNHCKKAEKLLNRGPLSLPLNERTRQLQKIIEEIKAKGKGKPYDCIIGLSGGVDSSYVALKVKEMGLRPLAVHLDNGWNSEASAENIKHICNILNIDLYTYVIDWDEFKDLQLAFLKASTPDSEIPSDHAIVSILYKIAKKKGIKFIIGGTNITSESIMPASWSQGHADWKYISGLQHQFGKVKLKSFPHRNLFEDVWNRFVLRIQWVELLNYLDYDKEKAKKIIRAELKWQDYGRKHGESHYTRIFQEYILPVKFGYDKRRAHYSSLIVAGQLSREQALKMLQEPLYLTNEAMEQDINYLINKLGTSKEEFKKIMNTPPKNYWEYDNYQRTWYYKLAKQVYRLIN
jgi:N-acetyl sugar amidotransferase